MKPLIDSITATKTELAAMKAPIEFTEEQLDSVTGGWLLKFAGPNIFINVPGSDPSWDVKINIKKLDVDLKL